MLEGTIPPLDALSGKLLKPITVVINGSTLTYALETSQEVRNKFFRFALLANSVVCCRVSPKQKADVVHLAKSFGPWTTLSIGDGANDVPMIMEAHVGVGIYGKEGTQAARTADFALGQFFYLKKLLLFHGRLAYRRISLFILYYFYKNVIVVFTEIYFAFYNGFSGQIYWAEWLPMLYNSVWTSWPPLFSYVFDRVINILQVIVLWYDRMSLKSIPLNIQSYIKQDPGNITSVSLCFGAGWALLLGMESFAFSFL